MSDCIGITHMRKICGTKLADPETSNFCDKHTYQEKFTKDVLKAIFNGTNKEYKVYLPECKHWHNEKTNMCLHCNEKRTARAKINTEKKKEKLGGNCEAFDLVDDCDLECPWTKKASSLYCKKHKYCEEFANNELDELSICNRNDCHKIFCNPESEFKTCQKHRDISAKNRENTKEKDTRLMCLIEGCKYHANSELGNGYCGKCDKVQTEQNAIIASGKKPCSKWKHYDGCLLSLEINDQHMTCEVCRTGANKAEKAGIVKLKQKADELNIANADILKQVIKQRKQELNNIKENNRINKIDQLNSKINSDYIVSEFDNFPDFEDESDDESDISSSGYEFYKSDDEFSEHEISNVNNEKQTKIDETKYFRICTNKNCGKTLDLTHFRGINLELTVECQECRDKNQVICEKNRPNKKNKVYNVDPEKLKAKLERQTQSRKDNPLLAYLKDKSIRLAKQEEIGYDEYHKQKAKEAKVYRDSNPEKTELLQLTRSGSVSYRISIYKQSALSRNIQWNFDDVSARQDITSSCHYCGEFDQYGDKDLCGLDRKDNTQSYNIMNVVPCCEICNFMKGEIHYDDYLQIIRHIVANIMVGFDDFDCSNLFKNHCSVYFNNYKKRANKKEIPFELTTEDFNILTCLNCYMCGRQTGEDHVNGIDRIDNKKGYTLNNCLSCCGTCNYIKNKFDIYKMFKKMYKTVCKHYNFEIDNLDNIKAIVDEHIKSELEFTKNIIDDIKKFNLKSFKKELKNESKEVVNNDIEDERLTKISKKVTVIENDSSEDERPKKIIKKSKIEPLNNNPSEFATKKKQNKEKHGEKIKNAYMNGLEKVDGDHSQVDLLGELGISRYTVQNKIAKNNKIEKYGEEGQKKLETLRKQKQRAKTEADKKLIDDEIAKIKSGVVTPLKNQKLTKEEKTAKKTLQTRKQRETQAKKWGIDALRKKQAEEKQKQRKNNNDENKDNSK